MNQAALNQNGGQKIIDAHDGLGQVWISGYVFASKIQLLQQYKLHAICSAVKLQVQYPPHFSYMYFYLNDNQEQKLKKCLPKVYEFIEQERKRSNVLVHCAAGISRSAALLISYMMKKYGMRFDQSLTKIQKQRPCCQPNAGFQAELRELGAIWKSKPDKE